MQGPLIQARTDGDGDIPVQDTPQKYEDRYIDSDNITDGKECRTQVGSKVGDRTLYTTGLLKKLRPEADSFGTDFEQSSGNCCHCDPTDPGATFLSRLQDLSGSDPFRILKLAFDNECPSKRDRK
jgi:hypothetical protein